MKPRLPAGLKLYAAASAAASPLVGPFLRLRARRGREDGARLAERLGRTCTARPPGALVWLHGVSVGESLALLPLAERLRREQPDKTILITSGTRTAAEILGRRLPVGAIHQYAPVDTPGAARRFLKHWRPTTAIFIESELWPNLITAARARGVRLALASATLSAASATRWRRAPGSARALLRAFDLVLARDAIQAERLRSLGARVDGLADLKFGGEPLPADPARLGDFRRQLKGRRVLLAASTHAGEDELILSAFASLPMTGRAPPLLIIAPRHPERGGAIAIAAVAAGLTAARRSQGEPMTDRAVFIADSLGELGLWYRLVHLAVLCGSLLPGPGGHNPLEAARVGCPFITGGHTGAWPIYQDMARAGATLLLPTAELEGAIAALLFDDQALAAMAERARDVVAAGDALATVAVDRLLDFAR